MTQQIAPSTQTMLEFNQALSLLGHPDTATTGVARLQQLAAQGLDKAAWNVGVAYLRGIHVPRNRAEGAAYMLQAARAGVVKAFYPVGCLYLEGALGSAPDNLTVRQFEAGKWFWRAHAHGDDRARRHGGLEHLPLIFFVLGHVGYR